MESCLHCRSSQRAAAIDTDLQRLTFHNRPQLLASIELSLEHRLTLLDWNAQLAAASSNLVRKLGSRNSSTSDLYQILALFFVFEGVVITAVAQASALKCHNSWLIFSLSTIASLATLSACIQKLREIADADKIYLQEKALCASLFNSIELLKEEGSRFDLVKGQPNLGLKYTDRGDQSSDSPAGFCIQVCSFRKKWVWSYAGAVCVVLLAFSGVTLAAVRVIVCDPLRNPQ